MKKSEKSLKEYFIFSRKYLLGVFIVGLLMFVLVQSKIMPQLTYNPISILAVLITFLAGWNAVREDFDLKQVAVIGSLCFMGMIWIVPFLLSRYLEKMGLPSEYYLVNLLIMTVINLVIYIIVAVAGGWISLKILERPKTSNV